MTNKFKALIATAMIALSFSAQAGVILTRGGEGVTNPDHTENFDGGTAANNITNEFATSGFTFTTVGTAGISLLNNSVCNNTSGGMSGKYLSMGQRTPCTGNTTYNAVSMMFDADVSELSWMGFNRTIGDGFTLQFFNDGKAIESSMFKFDVNNKFEKQMVHFTGAVFDQILITENSTYQGYFGIDNMAWKLAPVVVNPPVSDVPEPSIALLFGAGMIGMGIMRKKKQKAA